MAAAARRTISRRDLQRHDGFEQISTEVGELDPDAFDSLLEADPDAALGLLADLNGATDERLRELAHRLSAQVLVQVAASTGTARAGPGRLVRAAYDRAEGDLDVDASLDAIVSARRGRTPLSPADLTVTAWRRRETAVCLLVDRSGSMAGDRLATAAVTAAAVTLRAGADCSVVAFSGNAVVVSSQGESRPAGDVVVDLCRLRGSGVTDLGLALRAASDQLARSSAGRRVTILLSDCRSTAGGDPLGSGASPEELVVLAPGDDTADAEAFAAALGVKWAPLHGPSGAPAALDALLR